MRVMLWQVEVMGRMAGITVWHNEEREREHLRKEAQFDLVT